MPIVLYGTTKKLLPYCIVPMFFFNIKNENGIEFHESNIMYVILTVGRNGKFAAIVNYNWFFQFSMSNALKLGNCNTSFQ